MRIILIDLVRALLVVASTVVRVVEDEGDRLKPKIRICGQFTINQRSSIRTNSALVLGRTRTVRLRLLVLFGRACGRIRLWRPLFLWPVRPVWLLGSLWGPSLWRWLLRLVL